MGEVLRDQWCTDLEDLLQCPICYERPKGPVLQCKRGHHICNVCKNQMAECPLCKSRFSTARSYLAEELSVKLDAIKVSLQYPTQRRLLSVGSQTDARGAAVDTTTVANIKRAKRPAPLAPKGKFPCRVGACDATIAHCRMIPHFRYYHENKFYESTAPSGDVYNQIWELDFDEDSDYDLAIRVADMGLFFMHIKINERGELFGAVQIVGPNDMGKEFEYELKIHDGRRSYSFKEDVRSCRTNPEKLFDDLDCLRIKRDDMYRLISNDNTFTCTMTLNRLPEAVNQQTDFR